MRLAPTITFGWKVAAGLHSMHLKAVVCPQGSVHACQSSLDWHPRRHSGTDTDEKLVHPSTPFIQLRSLSITLLHSLAQNLFLGFSRMFRNLPRVISRAATSEWSHEGFKWQKAPSLPTHHCNYHPSRSGCLYKTIYKIAPWPVTFIYIPKRTWGRMHVDYNK